MITKERLEELIEQGATIWSEQFREKFLLKDFTNIDFFDNGFVSCFYNNRELIINLNKVFETQEETTKKRRYKITLDVYDEEPYFLPDMVVYNDVFIYDESVAKDVLRDKFDEMLGNLEKRK